MSKVIPISGRFTDAKTMLLCLAAEYGDKIDQFAMMIITKDGDVYRCQFDMTRANMAYASVSMAEWAREDVDV